MKKITLTRKELYEMAWKEPLTSISKRLAVKYDDLRKIYHNMEIPIPSGGYWSKLRWGITSEIVALPLDYSGEDHVDLYQKEPGDPDIIRDTRESSEECNTEPLFKVPLRLTNPDKLTLDAKEYFEANKERPWAGSVRILQGKSILSIDVQYSNLSRALRIFDTLIKILRSRGHEISFNWNGTVAVIYGEGIAMRLREIHKATEKPTGSYGSRELKPTGKFTFQIGNHELKTVSDGKKPIEEKIDSIIEKLEAEARQWHGWHLEAELRREEEAEKLRIKQEVRARKEKELSDFKSLYILANRLHQANIMRDYLFQVESHANENGLNTEEFTKWVDWARHKIEWYDPVVCAKDETFTEEDKLKIFHDLIQRPTSLH